MTENEFVTPREASTILGCSLALVYLAIRRRELIPIHPASKLLRRADVEAYHPKPVGAPPKTG